ncbi:MAG: TonB family protein [Candidatus Aminicenantes bacterium]|nr:TonB family protein [Candidatus Aminicenantes bacterium]
MSPTFQAAESLRSRAFGLKALVADYDSVSLEILCAYLKEIGMEVIIAKDGLAALELFRNQKPQIVFLEAMLPKISGFDLSQQINIESQGRVPVIIVTGIYKDTRHRLEAIQTYKAAAFLTKPWQREEMAKTIIDVLGPAVKPAPEEEDFSLESLEELTPILKEKPPLKSNRPLIPSMPQSKETTAKEPPPVSDEIDKLLEKTLAELGFEGKKKPSPEAKKESSIKFPPKPEVKTITPEIKPKEPEGRPTPPKAPEPKILDSQVKEIKTTDKQPVEIPSKKTASFFMVEKEKIIDTEKLPFAVSAGDQPQTSEGKDIKVAESTKPSLFEDKKEEEGKAPLTKSIIYPSYFTPEHENKKRPTSLLIFGVTGLAALTLLGVLVFRPKKQAPLPTNPLVVSKEALTTETGPIFSSRLEEQEMSTKLPQTKETSRQKESLSGLISSLKKEETSIEEVPPVLVTESKTAPLAFPVTPPPQGKIDNQVSPTAQESTAIQEGGKTTSKVEPSLPPLKEGDLVPLDQVDIQPRPIHVVQPRYPEPAKQMGLEGVIVVNALISENGEVIRTEILRGLKNGRSLEQAAQNAIRQWKFTPAVKDGVKVKVWKPIETRFRLKQ